MPRTGKAGTVAIEQTSVVAAPISEVFAWHERPGAIRRLLPPWQPISVLQEASSLDGGRAVLRLPMGLRWVAEHSGYEPPHRFVDRLVSLPLPWRHEHRFEEEDEATRVTDVVSTPVPAGVLRPTFTYRHEQLAADLAVHREMAALAPEPLTVAMTGASGLIGTALGSLLTTGGHRVIRLVRRAPSSPDERHWDPAAPAPSTFADVDAVVHLGGESIGGRFTDEHKRRIRESRVGPTTRLSECIAGLEGGPRVLVSASAIGRYGAERGDELLDESSEPGTDFLARLVTDWEAATAPAQDAGVRVVHVRTGIVQSPRGGPLRLQLPLYRAGLGGRLGDGSAWLSWIDVDDVTDIYYRAIVDGRVSGPLNAVAPHPVTSSDYAETLGRVLRRPAVVPVPALGPRLLLGSEGARELALASQRVAPRRLEELGHRFRRPTLEACLATQLGRRGPGTDPGGPR